MTLRIAFLGDTLLGGAAEVTLERRGYGYAMAGLRPLLAEADLVVANHEGPLTRVEEPAQKAETGRKRYWYRGRPEAAAALKEAGVGVVSLANNHVLDFGVQGLIDTTEFLDQSGIGHCGAGQDARGARQPVVVTVAGCRIGFLSYMQRYDIYVREGLYASDGQPGCARLRMRSVRQDLAALEPITDLRVVLVHWGRNYRPVSARQERLATALRAAGADLVVGHHPHIPQRVDLRAAAPVFFSLGNGPLGTPGRFHSGRPPYGLVALIGIDRSWQIVEVEIRAIAVDNGVVGFRPVPVPADEEGRLVRSLVSADDQWLAADPAQDGNAASHRWSRNPATAPNLGTRLG